MHFSSISWTTVLLNARKKRVPNDCISSTPRIPQNRPGYKLLVVVAVSRSHPAGLERSLWKIACHTSLDSTKFVKATLLTPYVVLFCRPSSSFRAIFTARCYTCTQSAILLRQSVCPSVTLRYRDRIGWNTSKIISWLVSLGDSCLQTPTMMLAQHHGSTLN